VKELVEYLARSLVSHPEEVSVREVETDEGLMLELKVDPDDLGMVIGRKGRTAGALRTLVQAAVARQQRHVVLEILD
jgi:hypothetical protein